MKQSRQINVGQLLDYLQEKGDWVLLRDICKHFTVERGYLTQLSSKTDLIEKKRVNCAHETAYRINNYLSK